MGSKKPKAPKPSPEQQALQREQAATVRQQRGVFTDIARKANLLQPGLFEEIGLRAITTDNAEVDRQIAALRAEQSGIERFTTVGGRRKAPGGPAIGSRRVENPRFGEIDKEIARLRRSKGRISGFERIADPRQAALRGIGEGLLERTQAALRGENQDPRLQRELEEQQNTFEQTLIRDFGSLEAARNSSAGIARINAFRTFRDERLDASNRADINQFSQLGIQNINAQEALTSNFLNRAQGVLNLASPAGQGLGQAAGGFANAITPLQQQSNAAFAAAQNQPSFLESAGGIAATVAGAVFSAEEAKENFEDIDPQEILERLKQLKITRWNYKGDPKKKKFIGTMAGSFGELFGEGSDEKTIPVATALGATMASIQALDEKVTSFEQALKKKGKK